MRLSFLALLVAALWFGNLGHRHLVDPDEGRYAEIPREMVATGDWITPRLNGIKYFEKPALQYWATALAYELFGEHEWTARLWSGLTGFLGVLVVWWTGRRSFGAEAGLNAALVLAGSLGYVAVAEFNNLDMGVTFFLGAALCAFLAAQDERTDARGRRIGMLLAWAATAGAILSKGLIGLVLPGLVVGAYILLQRDWRMLRRLHLGWGLALLVALTAPWFVTVSLRNPGFFDFFFIHEHFVRFLTKEHHRYQPWWWFVPLLLVGIFPWIVSAGAGLARAWNGDAEAGRGFRPRRFLLLWAVLIFVFFSASSSKLPAYILPIFPALALLAGDRLTRTTPKALAMHFQPTTFLWLVLLGAALYFASGPDLAGKPLAQDYAKWIAVAAALGLAGAAAAVYSARRGRTRNAVLACAAGGLVAGQLLIGGFDVLSPERSGYYLAQAMKPYARSDVPIYSVGTYDQTLPFYLKRTLTLVGYRGELGFGLDQEPDKWVADITRFPELWRATPEALAVMTPLVYEVFSKEGLPMQKIAESSERLVVRKP